MGFLWDLIQQSQISEQKQQTRTLEQRVEGLERELGETRRLLHTLLVRLESSLGEDIDRDGKVG